MSLNKTDIEWTEFTSNPVKGECPVDCSYCYVKPFRVRYGWHKDIRFYPQELDAIRRRKKPSKIFIGSTIELFHDKTIQYMPEIMDTIRACPQHCFYLLTKQPRNAMKLMGWKSEHQHHASPADKFPDNVWFGVSITNNREAPKARDMFLEKMAKVNFISFEPLLSNMDKWTLANVVRLANWVIIGAMTGSRYDLLCYVDNHYDDGECELTLMPYGNKWTLQPKIEWVREIVLACDKVGIPVCLKNNLYDLFMGVPHSDLFWEDMSHLRQELPTTAERL